MTETNPNATTAPVHRGDQRTRHEHLAWIMSRKVHPDSGAVVSGLMQRLGMVMKPGQPINIHEMGRQRMTNTLTLIEVFPEVENHTQRFTRRG